MRESEEEKGKEIERETERKGEREGKREREEFEFFAHSIVVDCKPKKC